MCVCGCVGLEVSEVRGVVEVSAAGLAGGIVRSDCDFGSVLVCSGRRESRGVWGWREAHKLLALQQSIGNELLCPKSDSRVAHAAQTDRQPRSI